MSYMPDFSFLLELEDAILHLAEEYSEYVGLVTQLGGVIAVLLTFLLILPIFMYKAKMPLQAFLQQLFKYMKIAVYVVTILLVVELGMKILLPVYFVHINTYAGTLLFSLFLILYMNSVINSIYAWKCKELRRIKEASRITQLNGMKHLAKILLYLIVIISVMQYLKFPFAGLLAGLGAGTLAVGIAMQDIIRNVFGGLVIFISRPFKVGDYISSPQAKIEGRVEEIRWRATEVINSDGVRLQVPNGTFISLIIINLSDREGRKFTETFGVSFEGFDQVRKIINDCKQVSENQAYIEEGSVYCYFVNVEKDSCEIMVRCLFSSNSYDDYLINRANLIDKVLEVISENKAQTIWIKSSLKS